MTNEYIDLRTLKNGTRFLVKNGNWTGYIFSLNGEKYMHIDETCRDVKLTGREELIIEVQDNKIMILDAKEAKRQSEQNAIFRLQEKKANQLMEIKRAITDAIEYGLKSTSYYGDMYDETAERLYEAGYRIIEVPDKDLDNIKRVEISWEDVD